MVKKMKWKAKNTYQLSYVVFLSSAWKTVGMTMTCNRCDVMTQFYVHISWNSNTDVTLLNDEPLWPQLVSEASNH